MPFDRFCHLVEFLSEVRKDEAKERMIEAAFIGFQMGAAGDKNFGAYLESLGLKEKTFEEPPMTAKDIATLKRLAKK